MNHFSTNLALQFRYSNERAKYEKKKLLYVLGEFKRRREKSIVGKNVKRYS